MSKKESPAGGKPANKSQAIRALFDEDPAAETQAVIDRLAAEGVKVSPTMVYYVRSKLKQATRKAKRERVAAASRSSGSANPVELVLRVKDIAREVGGMRNLKMLVDLLAE